MLTNLNWLEPGAVYPPEPESKRIKNYIKNEKLFLTERPDEWKELFDRLARNTKKKYTDPDTVLNYQQLLSKKTADFVCGEPPEIETEANTDGLDDVLSAAGWHTRLYEAFIDVSRYGNAVLKIVGKGITAVSPMYWFPIVDPADLKTVTQHVVAYPITPDSRGQMTELYAEIHSVGSFETRIYGYDSAQKKLGERRSSAKSDTGLDSFAVQILTNVTHSSSIYGIDDYSVINSIVAKLMWRLLCIDTVLDKHSEPSMSGPSSSLTYDERFKTYYLDLGNYFRRDTADDPDVKYITWDGNLEAAYKEIEFLTNQLYILSEMGQAFLEGGGGGTADSGTALKLRMTSPRTKAARLVGMNDSTVKRLIVMLAGLNGIMLDESAVTLHWSDGLPDDFTETVNTLSTAVGGPIMSKYAALKRMGLSDDEAEAEIEQMREESAAEQPMNIDMFEGTNGEQ